ncbi:hypothetical protein [Timonella sp. A28]|uniref:hypothetical protein n=1 Tax=Timonella sp. A28 TaxID=3442640 RepID=UPI003EB9E865
MTEAISPRTVIEGFLQPEHPTALNVVFDAANHVGIPDQPIRLALRRMIAAGDIEQVGRGRSGKITLTPSGKSRLLRDRIALQFAFDQDNHTTTWDGTWKLLAFKRTRK